VSGKSFAAGFTRHSTPVSFLTLTKLALANEKTNAKLEWPLFGLYVRSLFNRILLQFTRLRVWNSPD